MVNNMSELDKKIIALHNQGFSVAEIEKKLDPKGEDYFVQKHSIEFVIKEQRPATTPVRGPVATWIENEDGSGFWSDCWVGS
jgi:hypothetical protein